MNLNSIDKKILIICFLFGIGFELVVSMKTGTMHNHHQFNQKDLLFLTIGWTSLFANFLLLISHIKTIAESKKK